MKMYSWLICLAFAILLENAVGRRCQVCVIGGGPGGIMAAKTLQDKGYSVTLFEKEAVLGGKTVPFKDSNGQDLVRHIVAPHFEYILQLAQEYGVSPIPKPNERYFFFESGQLVPSSALGGLTPDQYQAILTYEALWTPEFIALVQAVGHDDVPAELTVPFRQWLAERNLSVLEALMFPYTTNYGYGFASEIPAIYYLKYFLKYGVRYGVSLQWDLFPYHTLLQQIGSELDNVELNAHVESIHVVRHVQLLKIQGQNQRIVCSKTIMAVPPTEEMRGMIQFYGPPRPNQLDLQAMLEEVQVVTYHEMILDVSSSPTISATIPSNSSMAKFFNPVDTTNTPNVYVRPSGSGDGRIIVLVHGGKDDTRSESDIFQIVQQHLQTILQVTINESHVFAYKAHPYFPHVSTESMNEGFYATFASIQGENNLFFVSGLQDFELVQSVMQVAQDVVNEHF